MGRLATLLMCLLWCGAGCSQLTEQRAGYDVLAARPTARPVAETYKIEKPPKEFTEYIPFYNSIAGDPKKQFKQLTGQGVNPDKARQLMAQGERDYQAALRLRGDAANRESQAGEIKRLLSAAGKSFDRAASLWPGSSLAQDAHFYSGECWFFQDQYTKANDRYEHVLEKFPNSRHLDAIVPRRYRIAEYWLQLAEDSPEPFYEVNVTDDTKPWRDTFGNAVRIFDKLRLDDPTGPLADDAALAAGNAYYRRGDYLKADEFYTDLRTAFPNSEHQFAAHYLGMRAKLANYQGPDYSGEALAQAAELLEQIRRQFKREAQENASDIARAHRYIRFKQAERDWFMARYFQNRQEYGAARYYYQFLVDDFADVEEFAGRAREALNGIADKPPEPPQRLAWLVKLFPREKDPKPLLLEGVNGTFQR